MSYLEFLKTKALVVEPSGFDVSTDDLSGALFDWQKAIVKWSLMLGKSALFEDCGLGKTFQQLEWARCVNEYTGGHVFILAPLAVAEQTRREGERFGIKVKVAKDATEIEPGVNISNYEKLHKFDCSVFSGVVLDESSILKNFAGKTRNDLIDAFRGTPYKLCCTATPSPNDYTELGNTAEFLGVRTMSEMKSMFFVNDPGDTSAAWRLRGHAEKNKFWEWLSSWAIMMRRPSDIGFSDEGFGVPELRWHQHIVPYAGPKTEMFVRPAVTMSEIRAAMKESLMERCEYAAGLNNESDAIWLNWCNMNPESEELTRLISGAVEVAGKHANDQKARSMLRFSDSEIKALVTKPSLAGFGMNWQNCNNMCFVGLSHSFEQLYQAVRRCWRFGQKKPVDAHIVIGEREGNVLKNILRKEKDMETMHRNMIRHMSDFSKERLMAKVNEKPEYNPATELTLPKFLEA